MKGRIGFDPTQGSTWRGIVMLIVSAGITEMPQESLRWFIPLCLVVVGLLGVFIKDAPAVHQIAPATGDIDDVVKEAQE